MSVNPFALPSDPFVCVHMEVTMGDSGGAAVVHCGGYTNTADQPSHGFLCQHHYTMLNRHFPPKKGEVPKLLSADERIVQDIINHDRRMIAKERQDEADRIHAGTAIDDSYGAGSSRTH